MSRKITNHISLVQSQLGLSRTKIVRLRVIKPNEESIISDKLKEMEQHSTDLLGYLDELETKPKGGQK